MKRWFWVVWAGVMITAVAMVGCGGFNFGSSKKGGQILPVKFGDSSWTQAQIVGWQPRKVTTIVGAWKVSVDPKRGEMRFEELGEDASSGSRLFVHNSGLKPESYRMDGITPGAEWHPKADEHSENPHIIGRVKWKNLGTRSLHNLRAALIGVIPIGAASPVGADTTVAGYVAWDHGITLPAGGETPLKDWIFDVPGATPFTFIIQFYADTWQEQWSGILNDVAWATSSVAFAVGEDGLILRTTDGGVTWHVLDTPRAVDFLGVTVAPGSPDIVYVCGKSGTILKTLFGTKIDIPTSGPARVRWDVMSLPGGYGAVHINDIFAISASIVVAACENGRFLRTTDGGGTLKTPTTWSEVTPPTTPALRALHFIGTGTTAIGYAAGLGSTVLKSTNSGASWSSAIGNLPAGLTLNGVVTLTDTTAVVVGNDRRIYKTTDSGSTWTERIAPVTGTHLYSVARRPAVTPAELWTVGAVNTVLRSTDAGDTWAAVTGMPAMTTNYGVAFEPGGTKGGIAGLGSAAILVGEPPFAGANWTKKVSGVNTTIEAVVFVTGTEGYAVSGPNLLKTTDGGESWTVSTIAAGVTFHDITHVAGTGDTTTLVAVGETGNNGVIYRTTNGGISWTLVHTVAGTADFPAHLFGVSNVSGDGGTGMDGLVAVGSHLPGFVLNIRRSLDGGTTWVGIGPEGADTYRDAALQPGTFTPSLWLVGNYLADARILYSTNYWVTSPTFTSQTAPTGTGILYNVQFLDGSNGFACGVHVSGTPPRNVIKTTNAGVTWTATGPSGITNTYHRLHFLTTSIGYVVGANTGGHGLALTRDGGSSWRIFSTGLDTAHIFYGVFARPIPAGWVDPPTWAVGTSGVIVRYR